MNVLGTSSQAPAPVLAYQANPSSLNFESQLSGDYQSPSTSSQYPSFPTWKPALTQPKKDLLDRYLPNLKRLTYSQDYVKHHPRDVVYALLNLNNENVSYNPSQDVLEFVRSNS